MSPNFDNEGFPYAQKCVWRFVVPEEKTLHISFLEVNLEGNDSIVIRNGWELSGSSTGIITNKNPPKAGGYSSQTNVVSLEFESKSPNFSRKRSKGFRGIFKVNTSEGKTLPRLDNCRIASVGW